MPYRTTPYGSRYSGLFNNMVDDTLDLYVAGTLVESRSTTMTTLSAGATLPQAVTIGGIAYTFPADNGDAGEQLETDGAGVLTWEAAT